MNHEISTAIYKSQILSTYDIGKNKYRIVVNYSQKSTAATAARIEVEKCSFDHDEIWENVEHGTIEHRMVLECGLFSRMRSEFSGKQ
jgi:hypothetical protein